MASNRHAPDQRLGKKSRFLLESGETPNEVGRFEIEFVRCFFHFLHMKNYLFKIQWCSTISARIPSRFTDKVPFLADLSVSKTHFTDKPAFLSDLSVNFWPLWWWFTDKTPFLEHLSVKPGPKRLNFYGQAAILDHFVRNRHFWSKSFTDRRPVFIDVSVNGRDFCQMQRLINQHTMLSVKFPAKLFLLISIVASNRHAYEKNGWFAINCKSTGFSIWGMFF